MKRYLKNLMLSDVEESSNMMLNDTDPRGNTGFVLPHVTIERKHLGR